MNRFDYEEPTQMTIFPNDGEELFNYIRTLMSLFDSVSILRTNPRPQDGLLVDVFSSDPVVQYEGLLRLKHSGLRYSLTELTN